MTSEAVLDLDLNAYILSTGAHNLQLFLHSSTHHYAEFTSQLLYHHFLKKGIELF